MDEDLENVWVPLNLNSLFAGDYSGIVMCGMALI